MIGFNEAVGLGLVQGITEFLPISSSGHLILVSEWLGWPDQGLAFDVAVHLGTLVAVLIYFRRRVLEILCGWYQQVIGGRVTSAGRLGWLVVLATGPALIAGALLNHVIESLFRSPILIGFTTLVFGLVLWWADTKGRGTITLNDLKWHHALLIGIAQVIALVPGTSRSGITLSAGLALGLGRSDAAQFSFLMSIPVIVAAGTLKLSDLSQSTVPVDWVVFAVGALVAAVSALAVIAGFLRVIERVGVLPFVIYRVALGALIFFWFW